MPDAQVQELVVVHPRYRCCKLHHTDHMTHLTIEGYSHGGWSVRIKIFFGPNVMYLKCANPLVVPPHSYVSLLFTLRLYTHIIACVYIIFFYTLLYTCNSYYFIHYSHPCGHASSLSLPRCLHTPLSFSGILHWVPLVSAHWSSFFWCPAGLWASLRPSVSSFAHQGYLAVKQGDQTKY